MQDGRRFRTYSQSSVTSNARVILLLPADPEAVFIALWSRGFLLLPIVITSPILLLPAWISVWLALSPFRRVAEEVAAKGPEDLAPLTYKPKHRELLQMGKSVDGLLSAYATESSANGASSRMRPTNCGRHSRPCVSTSKRCGSGGAMPRTSR